MSTFLLYSILGSVVLTLLVNLIPLLFPRSAQRAREKIAASLDEQRRAQQRGETPRVRVFFPWKWMLLVSIVLTIVMNLIARFAGQ